MVYNYGFNFNCKNPISYLGADTETRLYCHGELLRDCDAALLMELFGTAWIKVNVESKAWAYMLSDGENFCCCDTVEEFFDCIAKLRSKTIVWYNAKFDFSIFDYYFLTHGWKRSEEIVQDKQNYGKLPPKTFNSLHGDFGQRYKMTIWWQYRDRQGHLKTHKFDFVDLCNVCGGGLARNLKDWNVTDKVGKPIRKLDMDYTTGTIEDSLDYMKNDTVGLKRLTDIVNDEIEHVTGLSFWRGDYITVGGLAKKTMLAFMYGEAKHKQNVKDFQEEFPMSYDFDKLVRSEHLYRGGLTRHNPRYEGKIVHGVYKFDENSMYPHKMRTMKLPYGVMKRVDEPIKGNINIYHITRMVGRVYKNKIAIWQDLLTKEYTDMIDEIEPFLIFEEELHELEKWYDMSYDYDFIYSYKAVDNNGLKQFVDTFYNMKKTEKGTKRLCAKIILNSSYGKLAERIERETGHFELSEDGFVHYVDDGVEVDMKNCLNVVIGAYVTALARTDIMSSIRKCCKENVKKNFLYCDTDSIHTFVNGLDTDDKELGKYKNEGEDGKPFEYAIYYAPKTYLMKQDETDDWTVHCKGVNTNRVLDMIHDKTFEEACKTFAPNVPIRCLMGLNVRGGKALILKDKFILRDDKKLNMYETDKYGVIATEI